MTVTPISGQIDLLLMAHSTPAGPTPPGTWVAVAVAVALLCGRAVLWLLLQLLKFLAVLALVATIIAIGFEVGSHWDALTKAAAHPAEVVRAGSVQHG
jgi:hypothetical protein